MSQPDVVAAAAALTARKTITILPGDKPSIGCCSRCCDGFESGERTEVVEWNAVRFEYCQRCSAVLS